MKSENSQYDAIVIGSGISGGWAAKELSEKGLKTLVLERGEDVQHVKDYSSAMTPPWGFDGRGKVDADTLKDYPIQSKVYAFNEGTKPFWVKDSEHPYTTPDNKPFHWFRGYQVGGRSITWGRQCSRWAEIDFEANAKDGHGIDWPIRYADIAPWYDYVERFIGVSGKKEGLAQLPDGQFLAPMQMNDVELHVKKAMAKKWKDRVLTIGRVANLSEAHKGRGPCQYRNLCARGCPFSAYFSSLSSTLPAAHATGNLTLRANSVVTRITYNEHKNRVSGVEVLDTSTGALHSYTAKLIFVCASTLNSTWLLLNSANSSFPNGLANGSGELGKNLIDQHYRVGASGQIKGFDKSYYYGSRPTGIIVPRFRNLEKQETDYLRGFNYQGWASRADWRRGQSQKGIGADFKDALRTPGDWTMEFLSFGESLPNPNNHVRLNSDKKDVHGLSTLYISAEFGENEKKMRKDMRQSAVDMLEAAGAVNIKPYDHGHAYIPGDCIHEMGTARMGKDKTTSVLNEWNQSHDIPNLFVTDGASMASGSCKNPSVTYMALTARAVDFAVDELKRLNI
ncbi:GMC oxidoreductase [Glaciecola siphonariae]|uniref:GMC oxidoreductase n=1 Tax=Glaciecola siphonariae TaxID=521012 RepID=A0ABV9LV11_9ALTE